jgi:hypothetical protein
MEQLLALDEPGVEPEVVRARHHLEECEACQLERHRLEQRQARLRALPALQPARNQWPKVAARLAHEHASRRNRWLVGGMGLAAALLVAFLMGRRTGRDGAALVAEQELGDLMRRSQALEAAIGAYGPDHRVLDGRTSRVASDLEDRIADVDDRLQRVELQGPPGMNEVGRTRLWQERVGLLDALVDVHVTRASNVGL